MITRLSIFVRAANHARPLIDNPPAAGGKPSCPKLNRPSPAARERRRPPIRRALISVSDKSGLEDFAAGLVRAGVALISTGGTARALQGAGLAVADVAQMTGFPEMMDGRLKTLHPKVHGGLLALRGNADHEAAQAEHGIEAIDLLAVNLYPFEETVAGGAEAGQVIENIDIGGPAMIRAARKITARSR